MKRPKDWNRSQWFSMPREERRPLARMNVHPVEYWYARLRYAAEQGNRFMAQVAAHFASRPT